MQRRLHGDSRSTALAAPPDGALAHDQPAQRRVADQEAGVHGDAAVEVAEPLAERGPVPWQPGPQRGERHALDPRHHPRDVVGVLGRQGRQREAAVAAEHGRHAVQRRGAGVGVPEELGVVVGVQVDEAGGDEHAAGVDHAGAVGPGGGVGTDGRHPLALDHDVGPDRRRPGAVDDRAAADGDRHAPASPSAGPGRCTSTRWRAKACMPSAPSSTPEARLLPPAHRGVHVDGGDPVGVDEHRARRRGGTPRRPPARRRCSTPRRTGRRGCRWPPPPRCRCRRRGSPAGPGRTAPRGRCAAPAAGATTSAGETK